MPENPVRNGYKFLGWYTEPNGSGLVFNENYVINGDMTVYGLWEALPPVPPTPDDNNDLGDLSGLPQTGMKIVLIVGSIILLGGCLLIIKGLQKRSNSK